MARRENIAVGDVELVSGGGEQSGRVIVSTDNIAGGLAGLSLSLGQQVEAIGTFNQSHKLKLKINGTEFWWKLDKVANHTVDLTVQDIEVAAQVSQPAFVVAARAANSLDIAAGSAVELVSVHVVRELAVNDIACESSVEESVVVEIPHQLDAGDIAAGSAIEECALTLVRQLNVNDIVAESRVRQPDVDVA